MLYGFKGIKPAEIAEAIFHLQGLKPIYDNVEHFDYFNTFTLSAGSSRTTIKEITLPAYDVIILEKYGVGIDGSFAGDESDISIYIEHDDRPMVKLLTVGDWVLHTITDLTEINKKLKKQNTLRISGANADVANDFEGWYRFQGYYYNIPRI